jgi:hypothetical protein
MLFSSSSHDSSSSDEEMLFDEMDQEVVMFFQCACNVLNFEDLLNDHEDEGFREFVDRVAHPKCFGHNVAHTLLIQEPHQLHIDIV